jgi:hypothetical protein
MSEGVFNIVALGRQASLATAVPASTIFPVDAGFLGFELDRATENPDEDFGSTSDVMSGRTSNGVRWATASLPFVARFQDIVHPLEMHVAKISGGTPTGGTATYTYGYTFDETSASLASALKPYTLEYGVDGTTQDEWRAVGVIANELELGFDALTAPGNSMWKGTLGLVAVDREPSAITGTATAPSTLETMEGHLSVFMEGTGATAFASLGTAAATLKQFSFRSTNNAVGRVYGGTADTASDIGRSAKGGVEFDALLAISSTTKTDIHDIYAASGSPTTERRWRIKVLGSGVNSFIIDFRASFRSVQVGENENERLYAVTGKWVKDSTLGGRGAFTLANAVATIP